MTYKKEELNVNDTRCIAYSCENPKYILIQPVDEHDIKVLDREVELISNDVGENFLTIAFKISDWNNDLSPWNAPAVFGKDGFGDGAKNTLSFIEDVLIDFICEKYQIKNKIPIILGGYSLAGLFSLWSSYQSSSFNAIVGASPSVWFNGWEEFIDKNSPLSNVIYLSLGDKEEKTKNQTMARVGKAIQKQEEVLNNRGIKTILEWNNGGHFQDSDIRLARGFVWCIKNI